MADMCVIRFATVMLSVLVSDGLQNDGIPYQHFHDPIIGPMIPGNSGIPDRYGDYGHQHRPPIPHLHNHGINDHHFVRGVGPARSLSVVPLPLQNSDHELSFNVSWIPPIGDLPADYSLEVNSTTLAAECNTTMCYEYNIPGNSRWWVIPARAQPYVNACAVKPGCSYRVRLIGNPWDGHTSANLDVDLDECVAGVCSCNHGVHLPTPRVHAHLISVHGELYVNVTWTLPLPKEPLRLPPGLQIKTYYVSIGKQMVSNAHPAPWFAHTINRSVETGGAVASGDSLRWVLLPLVERNAHRRVTKTLMLDVKLLARVILVDVRGCMSSAGNATAYDPLESSKTQYRTYALWAAFGATCVIAVLAVFTIGSSGVKRILSVLRPAPVATPLEPLRLLPAWLPLQQHQNGEGIHSQTEQSPLYAQKEIKLDEADEWEVNWSQVKLGGLIGSGAFGRVYAAQLTLPTGLPITVAVKLLTDDASEEEMVDFLREIAMLKHVGNHRHVVRLIACCTKAAPLAALLEHAPRGDLLSLLRAARGRTKAYQTTSDTIRVDSIEMIGRPSETDTEYTNLSDSDASVPAGKFSLEESEENKREHYVSEPALHLDSATMREYALQVALGMRHLEQRGITHRDLAARNILVDGAGVLKVADFGLSRSGVYVHTRFRPVPLRWLAPEAILYSQYCSKSDVWAFAVLLWEIATLGGFPYAELSNHEVSSYLAEGKRLPKPSRASASLYQLMTECWAEDPEIRPTFANIVDKLTAQHKLYVDLDCL